MTKFSSAIGENEINSWLEPASNSQFKLEQLNEERERKLIGLGSQNQYANLEHSYTKLPSGNLESNANKIWNNLNPSDLTYLRDYAFNNYSSNVLDSNASRRIYEYGLQPDSNNEQGIKFGISTGAINTSDVRYNNTINPKYQQAWRSTGPGGPDLNNKYLDKSLTFPAATTLEAIFHGNSRLINNRKFPDYLSNDALAETQSGVSEKYALQDKDVWGNKELTIEHKKDLENYFDKMLKLKGALPTRKYGLVNRDNDGRLGEDIDIAQSSIVQWGARAGKALYKTINYLANNAGVDEEYMEDFLNKYGNKKRIWELATQQGADLYTGVRTDTREEQAQVSQAIQDSIAKGKWGKAILQGLTTLDMTIADSAGETLALLIPGKVGLSTLALTIAGRTADQADQYKKNNGHDPSLGWITKSLLADTLLLTGERLIIGQGVHDVLTSGGSFARAAKGTAKSVGYEVPQEMGETTKEIYMTQKEGPSEKSLTDVATSTPVKEAGLLAGMSAGALSTTGHVAKRTPIIKGVIKTREERNQELKDNLKNAENRFNEEVTDTIKRKWDNTPPVEETDTADTINEPFKPVSPDILLQKDTVDKFETANRDIPITDINNSDIDKLRKNGLITKNDKDEEVVTAKNAKIITDNQGTIPPLFKPIADIEKEIQNEDMIDTPKKAKKVGEELLKIQTKMLEVLNPTSDLSIKDYNEIHNEAMNWLDSYEKYFSEPTASNGIQEIKSNSIFNTYADLKNNLIDMKTQKEKYEKKLKEKKESIYKGVEKEAEEVAQFTIKKLSDEVLKDYYKNPTLYKEGTKKFVKGREVPVDIRNKMTEILDNKNVNKPENLNANTKDIETRLNTVKQAHNKNLNSNTKNTDEITLDSANKATDETGLNLFSTIETNSANAIPIKELTPDVNSKIKNTETKKTPIISAKSIDDTTLGNVLKGGISNTEIPGKNLDSTKFKQTVEKPLSILGLGSKTSLYEHLTRKVGPSIDTAIKEALGTLNSSNSTVSKQLNTIFKNPTTSEPHLRRLLILALNAINSNTQSDTEQRALLEISDDKAEYTDSSWANLDNVEELIGKNYMQSYNTKFVGSPTSIAYRHKGLGKLAINILENLKDENALIEISKNNLSFKISDSVKVIKNTYNNSKQEISQLNKANADLKNIQNVETAASTNLDNKIVKTKGIKLNDIKIEGEYFNKTGNTIKRLAKLLLPNEFSLPRSNKTDEDTEIRVDPDTAITKKTANTIKELRNKPFKMKPSMLNFFLQLKKELKEKTIREVVKKDSNLKRALNLNITGADIIKLSEEGSTAARIDNIQAILDFLPELYDSKTREAKEIYFDYQVAINERLHLLQTTLNFQNDKLFARESLTTNKKYTVKSEKEKRVLINNIIEELEIAKTDKDYKEAYTLLLTPTSELEKLEDTVTLDSPIKDKVKLLIQDSNIIKNNKNNILDSLGQLLDNNVYNQFENNSLKFLSLLHAIQDIRNSVDTNQEEIKTDYMVERDAVTSGVYNTLLNIVGFDPKNIIPILHNLGMEFNNKVKKEYRLGKVEYTDPYTLLTNKVGEKIQNIKTFSKNKTLTAKNKNTITLFNEIESMGISRRNLAKPVVMTKFYKAGDATIETNLVNSLTSKVITLAVNGNQEAKKHLERILGKEKLTFNAIKNFKQNKEEHNKLKKEYRKVAEVYIEALDKAFPFLEKYEEKVSNLFQALNNNRLVNNKDYWKGEIPTVESVIQSPEDSTKFKYFNTYQVANVVLDDFSNLTTKVMKIPNATSLQPLIEQQKDAAQLFIAISSVFNNKDISNDSLITIHDAILGTPQSLIASTEPYNKAALDIALNYDNIDILLKTVKRTISKLEEGKKETDLDKEKANFDIAINNLNNVYKSIIKNNKEAKERKKEVFKEAKPSIFGVSKADIVTINNNSTNKPLEELNNSSEGKDTSNNFKELTEQSKATSERIINSVEEFKNTTNTLQKNLTKDNKKETQIALINAFKKYGEITENYYTLDNYSDLFDTKPENLLQTLINVSDTNLEEMKEKGAFSNPVSYLIKYTGQTINPSIAFNLIKSIINQSSTPTFYKDLEGKLENGAIQNIIWTNEKDIENNIKNPSFEKIVQNPSRNLKISEAQLKQMKNALQRGEGFEFNGSVYLSDILNTNTNKETNQEAIEIIAHEIEHAFTARYIDNNFDKNVPAINILKKFLVKLGSQREIPVNNERIKYIHILTKNGNIKQAIKELLAVYKESEASQNAVLALIDNNKVATFKTKVIQSIKDLVNKVRERISKIDLRTFNNNKKLQEEIENNELMDKSVVLGALELISRDAYKEDIAGIRKDIGATTINPFFGATYETDKVSRIVNDYTSQLLFGWVNKQSRTRIPYVSKLHTTLKKNVKLYNEVSNLLVNSFSDLGLLKEIKASLLLSKNIDKKQLNTLLTISDTASKHNMTILDEYLPKLKDKIADAIGKDNISKQTEVNELFSKINIGALPDTVKQRLIQGEDLDSILNSFIVPNDKRYKGIEIKARKLYNYMLHRKVSEYNIQNSRNEDTVAIVATLYALKDNNQLLYKTFKDLRKNHEALHGELLQLSTTIAALNKKIQSYENLYYSGFDEHGTLDILDRKKEFKAISLKDYHNSNGFKNSIWTVLEVPTKTNIGIVYKNKTSITKLGMGINANRIKNGINITNEVLEYYGRNTTKADTQKWLEENNIIKESSTGLPIFRKILTKEQFDKVGGIHNAAETLYRSYAHQKNLIETQTAREMVYDSMTTKHEELQTLEKMLIDNKRLNKKNMIKPFIQTPITYDELKKQYPTIAKEFEKSQNITDFTQLNRKLNYVRSDMAHLLQGYSQDNLIPENYPVLHKWETAYKHLLQMFKLKLVAANPKKLGLDLLSNFTTLMALDTPLINVVKFGKESVSIHKELCEIETELVGKKINLAVAEAQKNVQKVRLAQKEYDRVNKKLKEHVGYIGLKHGFSQSLSTQMILKNYDTISGLQNEIDTIAKKIVTDSKGNPNFIHKGLMTWAKFGFSVGDVLNIVGNITAVKKTSFGEEVTGVADRLKNIKDRNNAVQYLNEMIAAPNSEIVRQGSQIMQMGDFTARWILYNTKIQEALEKKGINVFNIRDSSKLENFLRNLVKKDKLTEKEYTDIKDEAGAEALQTFVDYRMNLPKSVTMLSDYGIWMFPSFWMRIQRIVARMLIKKPVNVGLEYAYSDLFGIHGATILDSTIPEKVVNGSLFNLGQDVFNFDPILKHYENLYKLF